MRLRAHRPPWTVPALVGVAILVLAALVVSGLESTPVRTYALREPNESRAAHITPRRSACEAPVSGKGTTRGFEFFGGVASGDPRVIVKVFSLHRNALIASGRVRDPLAASEPDVRLDRPVAGGESLRVCVEVRGHGAYDLNGAAATYPSTHTTGVLRGTQFSLLLTRPGTPIGSLPRAFRRASIFRPSWIGSWLFWLLSGLLAVAFIIAITSVHWAATADREDASSPKSCVHHRGSP